MTVESALYPQQLNTAWPQASDMVSEGDNHIRLTKTVIKTTFPNVAGAVSATDVQLSYVTGVTSAIQAQIDSKGAIAGQTWTGTHIFPSTTTIGSLTPTIRGYLETVTSDAQAQLNARALKAGEIYSGAHNFTGAAVSVPTLAPGATGNGAASVDYANALAFSAALPGQAGNAGKFVKTNGAAASWASISTSDLIAGDVPALSLNGGQLAGFRNKIINGNFDVWQRGTSLTVSSGYANGYYLADRGLAAADASTTGSFTLSSQSFTPGQTLVPYEPTYFYRMATSSLVNGTNGFTYLYQQRIEDVRTFAGQTATISFYANVSANATIAVTLTQTFGNGGSGSVIVPPQTLALTPGFKKYTLTFTVPSISGKTIGANNYLALEIFAGLRGTTATAYGVAEFQVLANGSYDLAQVQLEPGSVATPFEHRPYGVELALAQRYYYRFTPAAADQTLGVGHNTSTTVAVATNFFPVAMRSAPSALEQSGTAGNYSVAHAATSTVCSAVPMFSTASTDAATTTFTVASGLTDGQGSRARAVNTSAYLAWSAEL